MEHQLNLFQFMRLPNFFPFTVFIFLTSLAIGQVPVIISFAPDSGPVGTEVTIAGANFSSTPEENTVFFGAARATVIDASETELQVLVPAGATLDQLLLQINGLSTFSSSHFLPTFKGIGISANSFATKVEFATGQNPRLIRKGDLDGDGKTDLVITNTNGGSISVLINASSESNVNFEEPIEITSGAVPYDVAFCDLDGDGSKDLIVANKFDDTISIFRNTSTPNSISFETKIDIETGNDPSSIAVADFNLDGLIDIAVGNEGSRSVYLYINNSSAETPISFETPLEFSTVDLPSSVVSGDFDLDGQFDLIALVNNVDGSKVVALKNMSTAENIIFDQPRVYETGLGDLTSATSIAIGDFDNDSMMDLAVSNIQDVLNLNSIDIFMNSSDEYELDRILFTRMSISTDQSHRSINIGNVDGDSNLDILATNRNSQTFTLYRGISEGNVFEFEEGIEFSTGNTPQASLISDLNNDGKSDLVVSNWEGNDIDVFKNIISPASETEIISFSFDEQTNEATITNGNVNIEVRYGSPLTSLSPEIALSDGATVSPASGVPTDFSNPVEYLVTAEDEETTQIWTVTVLVARNTETEILSFSLPEETESASITNGIINIEVANGTDVTSLVPEITVSEGASISPSSGTVQNFTESVNYTVIAEDGQTTQQWTVTVSEAALVLGSTEQFSVTTIYPNPTQNLLTVELGILSAEKVIIMISDLSGKNILVREENNKERIEFDISNYDPGIYVVSINDNTRLLFYRFVKN